jgi:methionyl-tRNA formyltransferase
MSAAWDQGAVYAQAPVRFPDGATMDVLDRLTGEAGGVLVAVTLSALATGTAQPVAQPEGGTYQSYPRREDFEVPVAWTARHAWNFMRAAEIFETPFAVLSGDRTIVAHRAVAYYPGIHNPESPLDTPTGLAIQFTDGVLVVT